jgi:thymidylate synthase
MRTKFKNASEAFDYLYIKIKNTGIDFDNTKALFNVGFYLNKPQEKHIKSGFRKWNKLYAQAEWQWYLSGDRKVETLGSIYGKIPEIWAMMADENGEVNSNYGWQWDRNNQLNKVIEKLKSNPNTRHAAISIYDGKEINIYTKDTPCTYAVQFTIIDDKLNMSVYMRSNDLWFGFCNDQYQFSMLQQEVAKELDMKVGWYYHHAHNMHLYKDKIK